MRDRRVGGRVWQVLEVPEPAEGADGVPGADEVDRRLWGDAEATVEAVAAREAARDRIDVGLVGIHRPSEGREVLQLGAKETQEMDHPGHSPHRVGPAAEAEEVDLVSGP